MVFGRVVYMKTLKIKKRCGREMTYAHSNESLDCLH